MTNKGILAELRTIRVFLAIDKEEELNGVLYGLVEVEKTIVERVGDEWDSLPTSKIAESCNVGDRTVQRRVISLEQSNIIENQGNTTDTEYRETGLLRAAELISSN
jgi:predicted transcriptional regulator